MRSHRPARFTLAGLLLAWVLTLSGMFIWSSATGHNPPHWWTLPFGCIALLMGMQFIYFRNEDATFMREAREKIGLPTRDINSGVLLFVGFYLILLGGFFVYAAFK